jgi:hypothetical protein
MLPLQLRPLLMAPVTRQCERNSALFAAVLARVGRRLLRGLDVQSLACAAATCTAGRAAVGRLGDTPWRNAIAAIHRDLTQGELPPARAGVYTSRQAQAAGEAAYAAPAHFEFQHDNAYRKAHMVVMDAAAKARPQRCAAARTLRAFC